MSTKNKETSGSTNSSTWEELLDSTNTWKSVLIYPQTGQTLSHALLDGNGEQVDLVKSLRILGKLSLPTDKQATLSLEGERLVIRLTERETA